MGLQQLINEASATDFEELLFWGRISGMKGDYYIAMGVTYSHQYEFPTKTFYFAQSNDFVFRKFRDMNSQWRELYDDFNSIPFEGNSGKFYKQVENETDPGNMTQQMSEHPVEERDPLEDTPPEDLNKDVVIRSCIEEDRLLYTVLAIENDC